MKKIIPAICLVGILTTSASSQIVPTLFGREKIGPSSTEYTAEGYWYARATNSIPPPPKTIYLNTPEKTVPIQQVYNPQGDGVSNTVIVQTNYGTETAVVFPLTNSIYPLGVPLNLNVQNQRARRRH